MHASKPVLTWITLPTAPHCALCTHAHQLLVRVALDAAIEAQCQVGFISSRRRLRARTASRLVLLSALQADAKGLRLWVEHDHAH